MQIWELLDITKLDEEVKSGYVTARRHESLPYVILNYTPKAAYDNHWNGVTLSCRGLIYSVETGEILARPFEKFFNLDQLTDEQRAALEAGSGCIQVTEKVDGSLGIMYPTPDGPAIATRGSFHSDQAKHATEWLRENAPHLECQEGLTFLFEIVYPDNRIVVDYGRTDELVLLQGVSIETGSTLSAKFLVGPHLWTGRAVTVYDYNTVAEAVAANPISNAEGFVVYNWMTGVRAKIKFEEYKRLHRILTNVTARTVWRSLVVEQMSAVTNIRHEPEYNQSQIERIVGCPVSEVLPFELLVENVPDEFYTWVHKIHDRLMNEAFVIASDVRTEYDMILSQGIMNRQAFAARAVKSDYSGMLFNLWDGQPIGAKIFSLIKPKHELPFKTELESK